MNEPLPSGAGARGPKSSARARRICQQDEPDRSSGRRIASFFRFSRNRAREFGFCPLIVAARARAAYNIKLEAIAQ